MSLDITSYPQKILGLLSTFFKIEFYDHKNNINIKNLNYFYFQILLFMCNSFLFKIN